MLDSDKTLVSKIVEFNDKMLTKYLKLDFFKEDKMEILKRHKSIEFRQMKKIPENMVVEICKNKAITGVDGSINTVGSSYPHYYSIMRALAKSTDRSQNDIIIADLHSPLLNDNAEEFEETRIQEKDEREKAQKMAILELKAAVKALDEMDTSIIMMDGSLLRYKIHCGALWLEFVQKALKKDIIVIGVIEEIKTKELAPYIFEDIRDCIGVFDREVLFGKLNEGEILTLTEDLNKQGLIKSFIRTSRDPHVIGLDVLYEQRDRLNDIADLVYTLTAEGGRGIPLWLDIVDSEIKITNKMMELLDTYIDPKVKKMLFTAKRENRIL